VEKQPSSTQHRLVRTAIGWSCLIGFILSASASQTVQISDSEALRIGKRIWTNESNGSMSGLTAWNSGEEFASLGIGHFIWYPQGVPGPFEESFPKFLAFAREHHAAIPAWLDRASVCPWNSRAEFLKAQNSPRMIELRQFLSHTVDLQAQFMVARLQRSFAKMLDEAAPADRANVQRQFERMASTPHGCYAVVDYVNFKGEGVLHTERYRGEGWGLLQVLEEMHGTENGPAATREFSNSSAAILRRRVQNSPPERHESRWLPGWLNRVRTYSQSS
jgi:hypothetical protein